MERDGSTGERGGEGTRGEQQLVVNFQASGLDSVQGDEGFRRALVHFDPSQLI